MNIQEKILITPKEAKGLLGVGTNAIYDLCKDKNFPSVYIGGRIYINKNKLQEWADKMCS
ncbi:helix-turn-helix domain-containing protein [Clostridium thermobutyricum]|uniref:helix-turn-helix domain-containing protein n=1 Tax=Clostridium thermobutyricum TaxID=29372 RepID=UPI0018A8EBDB|nr:helix-turn-helix domain-containing protein [Clostridium thermobutyricum]